LVSVRALLCGVVFAGGLDGAVGDGLVVWAKALELMSTAASIATIGVFMGILQ
jgi:hypothetical protein